VPARRRHPWVGFALFATLAVLGLFVLRGAAAGVASLLAMMTLIVACAYALRGQGATGDTDKVGLRGFVGHWL